MIREKIRVPRDVEKCIKKRRATKLLIFVSIEAALAAVLVRFGKDIFSGDHPEISWLLFGALIIAPIYFLKIPFWLFDKTWSGRIIQKSEEDYLTHENKTSVRGSRLQLNKCQKLLIELDDGKNIEYTVYDNSVRHAFRRNTYNVGDRVIHVGGTRYLQAVAVSEEDTLICVVCGSESKAGLSNCGVCGKTLKID